MWEYNNTISSDELYHYGVLGMKWGTHRAMKYSSANRIQKLKKKADKYEQKSSKYESKIDKRLNKGRDTFANNLLRGKSMAAHHRRKASRYMVKTKKYAEKAEKTRMKIEKEAAYTKAMKQKIKQIPKKERDAGYAFTQKLMARK